MTATPTQPPFTCPKCSCTDTKVEDRVFSGTHYLRESCCDCGGFVRYALAPQAPPTPTPAGERFMLAANMLDAVAMRVKELLHEMNTHSADEVKALALHSCALSAVATLSDENIASLTKAIRQGRLPRRKGA